MGSFVGLPAHAHGTFELLDLVEVGLAVVGFVEDVKLLAEQADRAEAKLAVVAGRTQDEVGAARAAVALNAVVARSTARAPAAPDAIGALRTLLTVTAVVAVDTALAEQAKTAALTTRALEAIVLFGSRREAVYQSLIRRHKACFVHGTSVGSGSCGAAFSHHEPLG